eukprot:Plantae.Rhodophyta-Rhodochaete_pulchella.ctg3181.p2 GENE.Plantae.Rhodophyta-Rhodochaete_pulchella.ctg3181~~Plantae.Rhodophyta-Rhodochaete_pulchella.ctg3181.p2  ORF type:complete len:262 (-),score=43.98 Plantae.Rhodophyta-Rhodochaete_pulchella.ctg3181:15-800(-)
MSLPSFVIVPGLSQVRGGVARPTLSSPCTSSDGVRRRRSVLVRSAEVQDAEVVLKERVTDELAANGIALDQLMNPEKVLKLEKKLGERKADLVLAQERADSTEEVNLQKEIDKMENELVSEKAMVMRQWLKDVFWYQGILTAAVGGLLSWGVFPGWSGDIPLVARALGFWLVWLFTIPSWRARKPRRFEKSALNVAFLATPLANLLIPVFSKDTFVIWTSNIAILGACYLYYFVKDDETSSTESAVKIKGVLRYLDWGSWR